MILHSGCEEQAPVYKSKYVLGDVYRAYEAVEVDFIGLTEVVWHGDTRESARVTAYLDLIDNFGSKIKSPGVFRFEIYEFVPRSSQPKGKRLQFWDDLDLTDPKENDRFWHDYLRAYKFELELSFFPKEGQTFILMATCLTPNGRRLEDSTQLTYHK